MLESVLLLSSHPKRTGHMLTRYRIYNLTVDLEYVVVRLCSISDRHLVWMFLFLCCSLRFVSLKCARFIVIH